MKHKIGYIITAKTDNSDIKYFSLDGSSGYPFWSPFFNHCVIFKSIEEAEYQLNTSEFTKPYKMSDGTVYPPRMIQSGADVNLHKKEGIVVIDIMEVEGSTCQFMTYQCRID